MVAVNEEERIAKENAEHPTFLKTVWREIRHDKMALGSLIVLLLILISAYLSPFFIDQVQLARINFLNMYNPLSLIHI